MSDGLESNEIDNADFHAFLISQHVDIYKLNHNIYAVWFMGYVESNMRMCELFWVVDDVFHKEPGSLDMGKQTQMEGTRT